MGINLSNKKPNSANSRSKACNATKRQQKINLQTVRCADGSRVRISAKEKKTIEKYAA